MIMEILRAPFMVLAFILPILLGIGVFLRVLRDTMLKPLRSIGNGAPDQSFAVTVRPGRSVPGVSPAISSKDDSPTPHATTYLIGPASTQASATPAPSYIATHLRTTNMGMARGSAFYSDSLHRLGSASRRLTRALRNRAVRRAAQA